MTHLIKFILLLQILSLAFSKVSLNTYRPPKVPRLACPRQQSECSSDFQGQGYCSYTNHPETGVIIETYTANKCSACQEGKAYSLGECKGTKVYCDIYNEPPVLCSSLEEPVCGFDQSGEGDKIERVGMFRNGCMACQAQVDYYVRGNCEGLNLK